MAARDAEPHMSLVDKYAMEAQQEFLSVSMKELALSGTAQCPRKYLNQRDAPLEIPMECVRKLCDAIDEDFDDRISVEELRAYIKAKQLPFEDSIPDQMYMEAIQGRGVINEAQKMAPLSHEEIAATVRGRHKWNPDLREWEVNYRPFRNYWIVLLLTVNKRIFAMPIPRVIPTKITAQYE